MPSSRNKSAHILMLPFPASGHILPHLDLTHQLAIRGLTITILVTPKNLHYLKPLLCLHPTIQTLVLPFPSHPSIPNGVENLQDVTIEYVPKITAALNALSDAIIQWFQNQPSPPAAIMADFLLSSWTQKLCSTLGVKLIGFSALNANSLTSFWAEDAKREFYVETKQKGKESWGLVINSFIELERVKLENVKKIVKHNRVWGVGPLVPIKAGEERGGPTSMPTDEVMAWLESCQVDNSLVYLGFGSQITLNKLQMEALADALEKSGVRFIRAVKEPVKAVKDKNDDRSVVPSGFEDRVKGRGLVIGGWAPQAVILNHRAVGSYLTHCGWGSVLEAILGEVLLLAWPMQVDHFFNTKLLVDELSAAIRVCEGLTTVPNSTNLAQILTKSVSQNLPERKAFFKLCEKAVGCASKVPHWLEMGRIMGI